MAAASVVHVTAGWPITAALALTGSIGNLFDRRYADPGSDEHLPDSIQQTGRTMRIGIRWTTTAVRQCSGVSTVSSVGWTVA